MAMRVERVVVVGAYQGVAARRDGVGASPVCSNQQNRPLQEVEIGFVGWLRVLKRGETAASFKSLRHLGCSMNSVVPRMVPD